MTMQNHGHIWHTNNRLVQGFYGPLHWAYYYTPLHRLRDWF